MASWTAVRVGGSGGVGEEDSEPEAGGLALFSPQPLHVAAKPVQVGGPEKKRSSEPGLGRRDQVYRQSEIKMVFVVGK
jgi:hypothetical protein